MDALDPKLIKHILATPNIVASICNDKRYLVMGPANNGDGWYRFVASNLPATQTHTGWKLHVSAAHPEALEGLAQLGIRHGIPEFKFIDQKHFPRMQNPSHKQAGKTAVFFYHEQTVNGAAIDWRAFMQEAEEIVHKHGGPGPVVQRDKPIAGSKALYYRNDHGAHGSRYVPRDGITQYGERNGIRESQLHNLPGAPDPFHHIDLAKPLNPPTHLNTLGKTAQAGEKLAAKSGGKAKWIIGGIAAAMVGVGAIIALSKKKSHTERENERRQHTTGQTQVVA